MDIAEILNDVKVFALWPRCFTLAELLDFMGPGPGIDHEVIRQALLGDSRFIRLRSRPPDEDRFILDSTLFRWLSNLNIRLAHAGEYRLDERQVALVMSHLRRDGLWDTPPVGAIHWGQSLGFVGPSYTSGQYVFPLARVLSFLSPSSFDVAIYVLKDLGEKQVCKLPLKKLLQDSLQEGFSRFSPKVVDIVQARAGLLTGEKETLEQIGSPLGLTRERIRQLEEEFWNELDNWLQERRGRQPFLVALLCDFMDESGSLVVSASSSRATLRKFLAKCSGIPCVELSQIGLSVLGASPKKDLTSLKSSKWFPDEISADAIASRLESEDQVSLIKSDVEALAKSMAQFRRKHLKGPQRMYLTLRAIGRPAHYSKITEIHNSLFPDHLATENNVHAILNRAGCSVVWIGVRGTYALEEWGYQCPSKTLLETVAEIVVRMHKRTGKAIPFPVIMAETRFC